MTYHRRWRCPPPLNFFVLLSAAVALPSLFCGTALGAPFSVFGPQSFVRGQGAPVTVTSTFDVFNPEAPYSLVVYNGGLQDNEALGELVSSSEIGLNGAMVVGPESFNQQVSIVEVPVFLAPQNELTVQLQGKPGGVLTIEILGEDDDPPVLTIASPADGAALDTADVTFSVDFFDLISGIDPASLAISIDGADATGFFTVSEGNAVYTASLGDGPHTVIASVSDRAGNTATATSTFSVETAVGLVSSPRAVPNSGDAPLTVRFIPEFETDSAIERFQWDFDGDGIFDRSEVIGRNQVYTYSLPGVYNATLRVTDSNGEQADGIAVVTVGNAPPEITAEALPSNGQIPLVVSFTLTATDSEGIALYEWDFEGDGVFDYSSTTSGNTSHTYTEAGTFQAVARVTDTLGASGTLALPTTEVRSAPPGAPSVTASANPGSGTVPLGVFFNASAVDPDGEAFTTWEWDFDGDGAFDSSAATPATSYTYTAPGTYFARVRVTAADGGTAEDVVQIAVLPSVSLSVSTDTIDPNLASAGVRTVLGGDTRVSVVIENRSGDPVKTLVPWGVRAAGTYTDDWDGDDEAGAVVAEGDYYAVLLYEVDGVVSRLDLRQTTGGSQFNPPRSRLPSRFQPFANNPLTINFTLSRAAEVTAFMGRFFVNTRLVTFLERRPLGRGTHTIVWNGENGDGQLIHPPGSDRFLFGIFGFTLANNAIYVRSGAHVSGLSVAPAIFDPTAHVDDQGTAEQSLLSFNLNKAADLELMVSNAETGAVLDRFIYSGISAGANTVAWDGRTSDGVFVAPGRYRLGLTAIDEAGFRSITVYTVQRIYY